MAVIPLAGLVIVYYLQKQDGGFFDTSKENGLEVNLLKTHQFSTISIAASFLKPIESAAEPEEETIYFYGAAAYLKEQIIDAFGCAAGSRFMYSANLFLISS